MKSGDICFFATYHELPIAPLWLAKISSEVLGMCRRSGPKAG